MKTITKMLGNRSFKLFFGKIRVINIIDGILFLGNLAKSFPDEIFLICSHQGWEEAKKICSSSCSRIGDLTFHSVVSTSKSHLFNIF